jgi:hypothetical protein
MNAIAYLSGQENLFLNGRNTHSLKVQKASLFVSQDKGKQNRVSFMVLQEKNL